MITVVAGGDSFIYGSELADQKPRQHSNSTFSALLANRIDAEYLCVALPGSANASITRRVIDSCESNKTKNLFVLVNWTFTNRYEFYLPQTIKTVRDNWYSITHWDTHTSIDDIKVVTSDEKIAKNHSEHFDFLKETGIGDFARNFYRYPGNTEVYELYTTMKEIVMLQFYLKTNNIPYMFSCVDSGIFYSFNFAQQNKSIINLKNQIDFDSWFFFPQGSLVNETTTPRGFYQWAVENKYPVGTTHPLELAHTDAAQLMQEKFNELVKKSI